MAQINMHKAACSHKRRRRVAFSMSRLPSRVVLKGFTVIVEGKKSRL